MFIDSSSPLVFHPSGVELTRHQTSSPLWGWGSFIVMASINILPLAGHQAAKPVSIGPTLISCTVGKA